MLWLKASIQSFEDDRTIGALGVGIHARADDCSLLYFHILPMFNTLPSQYNMLFSTSRTSEFLKISPSLTMTRSASYFIWLAVFILLLSAFSLYQARQPSNVSGNGSSGIKEIDSWCPIPEPEDIQHRGDGLRPSLDFQKPDSIELQVKRLSAAVHVPTESWDDNDEVDIDPRWKNFDEFHRVLKELFPKV